MKKTLDELTTEEWGSLFPIEISSYDPNWKVVYKQEEKRLFDVLSGCETVRIEHFGSTAVEGLAAKNTIDILVEIPVSALFSQNVIRSMEELGYHYFLQRGDGADYMVFGKGYHLDGRKEQTFHVHMSAKGHPIWDRLHFRNHLRKYPEVAKEYTALKLRLAEKYKNKRVDYRIAKTEFVTKITEREKQQQVK